MDHLHFAGRRLVGLRHLDTNTDRALEVLTGRDEDRPLVSSGVLAIGPGREVPGPTTLSHGELDLCVRGLHDELANNGHGGQKMARPYA